MKFKNWDTKEICGLIITNLWFRDWHTFEICGFVTLGEESKNFGIFANCELTTKIYMPTFNIEWLSRLTSYPGPIQWYHSQLDLIWPDGTLNSKAKKDLPIKIEPKSIQPPKIDNLEQYLSLGATKYVHIKSTTVYAPRRNWDSPPTPHPQASVRPPPCFWGEGNTRWRERGWESPNSDEGYTLWYSLYVRTLCLARTINI